MKTLQGGVVGNLVRHRTEQETAGPGHSLVADHDQVRVDFFGNLENRIGRIAVHRMPRDFHLEPSGDRGRPVKGEIHVLAGTEFMCHVSRRAARLFLVTPVRNRLEGAHDIERSPRHPGQFGRLTDRFAGRLGTVGTDNYALEQGHWSPIVVGGHRHPTPGTSPIWETPALANPQNRHRRFRSEWKATGLRRW